MTDETKSISASFSPSGNQRILLSNWRQMRPNLSFSSSNTSRNTNDNFYSRRISHGAEAMKKCSLTFLVNNFLKSVSLRFLILKFCQSKGNRMTAFKYFTYSILSRLYCNTYSHIKVKDHNKLTTLIN